MRYDYVLRALKHWRLVCRTDQHKNLKKINQSINQSGIFKVAQVKIYWKVH